MSTDDPFRLRAQKALSDALATITPANGYTFDFSKAVFRGRLGFGENDPLPMLSIMEPPLPLDRKSAPLSASSSGGDWDLVVQGFVQDDRENPTDPAHLAMAEVKKRLAQEARRKLDLPARGPNVLGLGSGRNRVEELRIGAGVVRPPEAAVSSKAYFWLTITLKIVEDNSDPFA